MNTVQLRAFHLVAREGCFTRAAAAAKVSQPTLSNHVAALEAAYKPGQLNEARLRMAQVPLGAELIKTSVTAAPGFRMGNVFVMAGVPKIMNAMMEDVATSVARGTSLLYCTGCLGVLP